MTDSKALYPLQFQPIFKEKVWGGNKLAEFLHKEVSGTIGESWEISGVSENETLVKEGPLKGRSLSDLIQMYKGDFLGSKIYERFGEQFPLLFKFIDASKDLSIQVHPDDTVAQNRHNSFGKTEMWYILQADEGARLILGFKEGVNKDDYVRALEEGTVEKIMREVPVKVGDVFYLEPGTVHAIGGGIVLAEIQQTSDITYRIYDWNRPDTDGRMRELHTEEALDVMAFTTSEEAELNIVPNLDVPTVVCNTPYFHTSVLKLSQNLDRDYTAIDSFVVYMCAEGSVTVSTEGHTATLREGDSLLIPACLKTLTLNSEGATILEVYVPSP